MSDLLNRAILPQLGNKLQELLAAEPFDPDALTRMLASPMMHTLSTGDPPSTVNRALWDRFNVLLDAAHQRLGIGGQPPVTSGLVTGGFVIAGLGLLGLIWYQRKK